MKKPLLFIPDISGFTKFIQTTEIEHSMHVISELLQVLIDANTIGLELAEIEGDALFFYKENSDMGYSALLDQMERMFTAFYAHLDRFDKLRICTCQACSTAPNLELKIVAHTGEVQFITVHKMRKPFGQAVIEVHRLLKNSVQSDNYVMISDDLANNIGLNVDFKNEMYQFTKGSDEYDGQEVSYLSSIIDAKQLKIEPIKKESDFYLNAKPNLLITKEFSVSAEELMEALSNYRYRQHWVPNLNRIEYDEKQVTRVGSAHLCVIDGKNLEFIAISTTSKEGQLSYGERTQSPAMVDELVRIFDIEKLTEASCLVKLKIYIKSSNPLKKMLIALMGKNMIKKRNQKSLDALDEYLTNSLSSKN